MGVRFSCGVFGGVFVSVGFGVGFGAWDCDARDCGAVGCGVVARALWELDSLVEFLEAFWAVGFGVAWALAAGVLGLVLSGCGLWCVDS